VTPEEKERIQKWHESLSSVRELELIKTDHQRCGELVSFCEGLTLLAPKVRIVQNEGDAKDLPALGIGPRLRYHAVPLGKELDAFLTALSSDPTQRSPLDPPVQEGIEKMDLPAFLQLFVTQQCPFCPLTVQQLLPLPAASEHIHLAIIDGTLFPEVAEKYSVQSAPTLLLDEQFRWTGSVPLQEVAQVLSDRDPASLGAESLESMLKEGNAFQVAQMMLEKDEVYSALIDLLVHEKMFVRLGAMVVMETIADQNAALAVRTVDSLWERFPHVSDQVKGDLIHVIGQAGDKSVISKLEALTAGQFPDEVQEAARDALAAIKERV
jgi:hypothetical protein